jgi:putative redox protein
VTVPITATAHRRSGYAHDVEVDGHKLVVDEPQESGGTDEGPSPTRLVAAALAACTAITVEMYAGRKDWELGAVEVEVEMEGTESGGRSFDVLLRIPVSLDEEQQEKLRVIAGKCPVHRMLAAETEVSIADRIECQG